jgi:hypothetical protein
LRGKADSQRQCPRPHHRQGCRSALHTRQGCLCPSLPHLAGARSPPPMLLPERANRRLAGHHTRALCVRGYGRANWPADAECFPHVRPMTVFPALQHPAQPVRQHVDTALSPDPWVATLLSIVSMAFDRHSQIFPTQCSSVRFSLRPSRPRIMGRLVMYRSGNRAVWKCNKSINHGGMYPSILRFAIGHCMRLRAGFWCAV